MYPRCQEDLLRIGEQSFSNPFVTFSSELTPQNLDQAFEWAEKVWNRLGMYRSALTRIISYFLTEVNISGVSRDRADEWETFLNQDLEIRRILANLGADLYSYGNSLSSIVIPFRRYLVCPRPNCGTEVRIDGMDYQFRKGNFEARCPKCDFIGKMDVDDKTSGQMDRLNVLRWSPHEMLIHYNRITGESRYEWDIPSDYAQDLLKDDFLLQTTPLSILKAASHGQNLLLHSSQIKHLKLSTLAGVETGGWGIPPLMSQFEQIYFVQLLRRFNEVMALDYLVPLRILTPDIPPQSPEAGNDPLNTYGTEGMPEYSDQLLDIVEKHRQDPMSWSVTPFPVRYGPVSGEGVQMISPELIEQGNADLLNEMGVPMEFYQGNLRWKGSPEAIRLLEKNWDECPSSLNSWLSWFTDRISGAYGYEPVDASLQPPSMFDDLSRKQLLLQLASGGQVSWGTALEPWDIDPKEELKNITQEQREMQEQMESVQPPEGGPQTPAGQLMGGGMGVGGPPGGSPAGMMQRPSTINGLEQRADQLAQYLLTQPGPVRDSQLRELKQKYPTLHALVDSRLSEQRQEVDRQGALMMRNKVFGAV